MEQQTVTLKLPLSLLKDASHVAGDQNVSIGHLVRELLQTEVHRRQQSLRPSPAGDRHLARLKSRLGHVVEQAAGWADLTYLLDAQGYELRPIGNGLEVYQRQSGRRVCNIRDLGISYRQLVRRFDCAMPGHTDGTPSFGVISPQPIQPRLPLDGDATFEVIDFDA